HCRWFLRVFHGDLVAPLPALWATYGPFSPGLRSQRQTPRRGRPGAGLVAAANAAQTEEHGVRLAPARRPHRTADGSLLKRDPGQSSSGTPRRSGSHNELSAARKKNAEKTTNKVSVPPRSLRNGTASGARIDATRPTPAAHPAPVARRRVG